MEELDFEKIFKLQMSAMKFGQCHPNTKVDIYFFLKCLLLYGPYTFCFYLLCNCVRYYLLKNDYFNAFRNCVPLTYYICMTTYFILLLRNRSSMGNLIVSMKNDYAKVQETNVRRKTIIHNNVTKGINIMKFWCVVMVATVVNFIIKSFVLTVYYWAKNGEFKLMPFHVMHYPLNLTELREHNYLIFAATFLAEMYFTMISVLIFFCTVPLGPIMMLHACGQLELIKIKFENIFENENVDENLKDIVKHLQYVYSFVKEINKCYTFIYEVMINQNVLLLPFTSYAIIQSVNYGEFTIEYAGILLQGIFTSSLPCYYGDLLMQKGEEVRLAAYNCGWERVHIPSARKTLLIILTRSLRPIAIETVFSTICLETLTDVFRKAYTIFNLMTAMW